jgi:peptide-methionine (R)-S-oxide reductase
MHGETRRPVQYPVQKTDAEWRRLLSSETYRVLREKHTETAFSGKLWDEHRAGSYRCAGCNADLFDSRTKFDSGTGWPSFYATALPGAAAERPDNTHGMERTEVLCARCGGHLGHLFNDGPPPTGLRYCINSAALRFQPAAPFRGGTGSGASGSPVKRQ